MSLTVELSNKKQLALIIDQEQSKLGQRLKVELNKYDTQVFVSSQPVKNLTKYNYIFIINFPFSKRLSLISKTSKVVFIYTQNSPLLKKAKDNLRKIQSINYKIIAVNAKNNSKKIIDKILWFSISKSKERFLDINLPENKSTKISKKTNLKKIFFSLLKKEKKLSKNKLIIFSFLLLFLIHILFIPFLMSSLFFSYKGVENFKQEKIKETQKYIGLSNSFLKIAKKLFAPVRPTYLLFSLALYSEQAIEINSKLLNVLEQTISIEKNSKKIFPLLQKKDKTNHEKKLLTLRINRLKSDLDFLLEGINSLNQKLPSNIEQLKKIKQSLKESSNMIYKTKSILNYSDELLAKKTTKKYLLLFANNMELRPGGGFIGSFGILTIKDFTLENFSIYDVYDADGQLKAHIEPPKAIKQYLNMNHWFLRDSNFSPDLLENYIQAKFFLDKEIKKNDFSGVILITTTGIQNILKAFGEIYLEDYNEKINKDNFYLKTQFYAENKFFPGSTQKKTFLGSLARYILFNTETASWKTLGLETYKSLNEKQIAVYLDNRKIQSLFDSFYWSGRILEPKCLSSSKNCLVNYLFPIDSNLGGNKTNFFINRSINIKTLINSQGEIKTSFQLKIKNNSPNSVFPGGPYSNYFQFLIPKDSLVKKITKNGVLVKNYEEIVKQQKTINFFFKVEPKKTVDIQIDYQLKPKFKKGKGVYQLMIQKQIGSSNSDLNLKIKMPKNIYLINQNFTPLVKGDSIIYNTVLSADKIFFIELIKE